MRQKKLHGKDSLVDYALVAGLLAACATFGTGCAGVELGGRLGVYRVDERVESQRTYRNPKPFICYLMPSRCAAEQSPEDVQGS